MSPIPEVKNYVLNVNATREWFTKIHVDNFKKTPGATIIERLNSYDLDSDGLYETLNGEMKQVDTFMKKEGLLTEFEKFLEGNKIIDDEWIKGVQEMQNVIKGTKDENPGVPDIEGIVKETGIRKIECKFIESKIKCSGDGLSDKLKEVFRDGAMTNDFNPDVYYKDISGKRAYIFINTFRDASERSRWFFSIYNEEARPVFSWVKRTGVKY